MTPFKKAANNFLEILIKINIDLRLWVHFLFHKTLQPKTVGGGFEDRGLPKTSEDVQDFLMRLFSISGPERQKGHKHLPGFQYKKKHSYPNWKMLVIKLFWKLKLRGLVWYIAVAWWFYDGLCLCLCGQRCHVSRSSGLSVLPCGVLSGGPRLLHTVFEWNWENILINISPWALNTTTKPYLRCLTRYLRNILEIAWTKT